MTRIQRTALVGAVTGLLAGLAGCAPTVVEEDRKPDTTIVNPAPSQPDTTVVTPGTPGPPGPPGPAGSPGPAGPAGPAGPSGR